MMLFSKKLLLNEDFFNLNLDRFECNRNLGFCHFFVPPIITKVKTKTTREYHKKLKFNRKANLGLLDLIVSLGFCICF